jgi:cell shape-determining protein MreC
MSENEARIANYNTVLDENNKLKEILGRAPEQIGNRMLVAAILAKPNRSLYDTLIIDAGANQGVVVNQRVFALGNIPIGRIAESYADSSKVILYSNPEEKTGIVVDGRGIFMQIVGRGGGNFEILLPKDLTLDNGTEVSLPGITPYIVGTVVKTISDPRDSFVKALLVSPVNIQSLDFVEVEK